MSNRGRVDLRSDTFTVPDPGMRRAMAEAEVGDDVWGEDPTVRRLEEEVAELLDKEAAVLVPSGTMANLIAVAAQTRSGDELLVDRDAHIVVYEVAGSAVVARVQVQLLDATTGVPDADQVEAAIRESNIHHPVTRLLAMENTHNRRGGAAIGPQQMDAAAAAAHRHGLRVHCDGARLLNAAVALDLPAAELVSACDSVSLSLSKGLGAPVGSVLAGDGDCVGEARRWRKRLGGGMRQAGILAAAGLYALRHNVARLADDHQHARLIAGIVGEAPGSEVMMPAVPTNIVMMRTAAPAAAVVERAAEQGVLVTGMGTHLVRCMTYLGIDAGAARRGGEALLRALDSLAA